MKGKERRRKKKRRRTKKERREKIEKDKKERRGQKEEEKKSLLVTQSNWDLLPYRPSHYHGATPSLSGPAPYYLSQILIFT